MMPALHGPLKATALALLITASGAVLAQREPAWYGGYSSSFWGLQNSVGLQGSLPGLYSSPGGNPEGLSASTLYSGYRMFDSFAIEGAQTSFGLNGSCGGDPMNGESYRSCLGSAWSLAGVATIPFQSTGLSLFGKMGMHYWQSGLPDEGAGRRFIDDVGTVYGIGLSYEFTKAVTFRAETERYTDLWGSNTNGASPAIGLDTSVHSIGLSIKF